MKVKCIKGFAIEKCDDNGFSIENEYFVVEEDSVWNIEKDEYRFIGGETRLTNNNGEWLEISNETFEEHFTIKPPFRVICIDDNCCGELVESRRYIVTKEIDDRYVLLGLSDDEYCTCYFERI